MNIAGMGTISNYIKSVELNVKWQERKSNPFQAKEDDPEVARIKQWSQEQQQSQNLATIHGKLMTGAKLTKEELEYVREKNPEMYEQAVKAEREREQYKKELENCRTKEDVERLHQRKLHQFATEAKAISSNPNIPKAKKIELLQTLNMRMNATLDERAAFMNTKEYFQLPEEEEDGIRRTLQKVKQEDGEEVADIKMESKTGDVQPSELADIEETPAASSPEPAGEPVNTSETCSPKPVESEAKQTFVAYA